MTRVAPWVQDIVNSVISPPEYDVGDTVQIKGKPCLITDGQYWGEHGLSNHWSWREEKPDGTLGRTRHGYGDDWPVLRRRRKRRK